MQPNYVVFGAVLTAACLSLMLINLPDFKTAGKAKAFNLEQSSANGGCTPVIIVNRMSRTYPMASGGSGLGPIDEISREEGEKFYRKGEYSKAILSFQTAMRGRDREPRCLLGLGNSYIGIGKYKEAIRPLSMLRNDCHRKRGEVEEQDKESYHDCIFKPKKSSEVWICGDYFDELPEQARDALDYEARQALEAAVLALSKKNGFQKDSASTEFKNERHYLALKACLKLAQQYHREKHVEEAAALFRLAKENTRNIPSTLITELSVSTSNEQRWTALARLALNATTPEEREWYEQELYEESTGLNMDDIRVVASNHLRSHSHLNEVANEGAVHRSSPSQKTPRIFRFEPNGKHRMFSANVDYERGMRAYDAGQLDRSREFFENALTTYRALNSKIAIADTRYNLGCIDYCEGKLESAKEHFKFAAINYRADKKHSDEEQASYNFAALSVDIDCHPADEEFLREYDEKFHTLESSTFLGLYLAKLNRKTDALTPLKRAATMSIEQKPQPQSMQDFWDQDKPLPVRDDKDLSEDEIFQLLFKRSDRVDHYVNSRFAPTDMFSPHLSRGSERCYSELTRHLYTQTLASCGQSDEVEDFEKLASDNECKTVGHSDFTEKAYLNVLQQRIRSNWYCPVEASDEHTLVRLRITLEGMIQIQSIERNEPVTDTASTQSNENRLRESIVREALQWSSPMQPPPAKLTNREILIIFDTHREASESLRIEPLELQARYRDAENSGFRW